MPLSLPVQRSLLLTPLAIAVARRTGFYDHPAGYKRHLRSTSYLGGSALVAGLLTSTALLAQGTIEFASIALGAFALLGPAPAAADRVSAGGALFAAGLAGLSSPAAPSTPPCSTPSDRQGVKIVHGDEFVITVGTAPFGDDGPRITPAALVRALLCVAGGGAHPVHSPDRAYFDALAHDPYAIRRSIRALAELRRRVGL